MCLLLVAAFSVTENAYKALHKLWATCTPTEKSMNRSIRLSVDSEYVKQDPDALLLHAILSLLPAGTTKQNLR